VLFRSGRIQEQSISAAQVWGGILAATLNQIISTVAAAPQSIQSQPVEALEAVYA